MNTITTIIKNMETNGNKTILNRDGWLALFEAFTEAQDNRRILESAYDEAEAVYLKRSAESDFDPEENDDDYNISVKTGNAYRKAEAARQVEAILEKAIADIYNIGHVEEEEEV